MEERAFGISQEREDELMDKVRKYGGSTTMDVLKEISKDESVSPEEKLYLGYVIGYVNGRHERGGE